MRAAQVLMVGALGLVGTSVHASPTASPAPSVSARQVTKTTGDVLARAEVLAGKISSQLSDNRALQSHAREGRDTLRLGCIESQLAVSRALAEASEATILSLRATVRSGQGGEAAYQVLVALSDESEATHHAAAACLGYKEVATRIAAPLALSLPARAGGTAASTTASEPTARLDVTLGIRFVQPLVIRVVPASP